MMMVEFGRMRVGEVEERQREKKKKMRWWKRE